MKSLRADHLNIEIHPDRAAMGGAAAQRAAALLRTTLESRGSARVIVASAPSQDECLAGLAAAEGIDWERVTVFHMDEYIGLAAGVVF